VDHQDSRGAPQPVRNHWKSDPNLNNSDNSEQSDNPGTPAVNYAHTNEHHQSADSLLEHHLRAGAPFDLHLRRENSGGQPEFIQNPRKNNRKSQPV